LSLTIPFFLAWAWNEYKVCAFTQPTKVVPIRTSHFSIRTSLSLATQGFGAVKERPSTKQKTQAVEELSAENSSADEAKRALIDLIPRMTGQKEEYRAVESCINLLEEKYVQVQTLDFLNMAMVGEWQLLFSTNLLGRPSRKLRLRELVQRVEPNRFNGTLTNTAAWEYAEVDDTFDANGRFSAKCSYSINQGARMVVGLEDHELRPATGSKIPSDIPQLFGLLHRAIPSEIFDPNNHAIDTTYLDADIRIVRYTGPVHEGVRNVFMRKGSLEIKPML